MSRFVPFGNADPYAHRRMPRRGHSYQPKEPWSLSKCIVGLTVS